MFVVNPRNISTNNVIAGNGVAAFKFRSMAYLQSGKH